MPQNHPPYMVSGLLSEVKASHSDTYLSTALISLIEYRSILLLFARSQKKKIFTTTQENFFLEYFSFNKHMIKNIWDAYKNMQTH